MRDDSYRELSESSVRHLHKPERILKPVREGCRVCTFAVFAVMVLAGVGVIKWALAR